MPTSHAINDVLSSPPERVQPAVDAGNQSPTVSQEVSTPTFDYIQLADPKKILAAEEAFREKCRRQPHKKMLFADSSDEDDAPVAVYPAIPKRTTRTDCAATNAVTLPPRRAAFVYQAPKAAPSASTVRQCPFVTSAQNLTSASDSDSTIASDTSVVRPVTSAAGVRKSAMCDRVVDVTAEPESPPARKISRRLAGKRQVVELPSASAASADRVGDRLPSKKRRQSNSSETRTAAEVTKTSRTNLRRRSISKEPALASETKENKDRRKTIELKLVAHVDEGSLANKNATVREWSTTRVIGFITSK